MVFSTNYFGSIPYFQALAQHYEVVIDVYEKYTKQTWRNRMSILGSNGPLTLSIPVKRPDGNQTLVKDLQIEYKENWQKDHWKAIESSYMHAPFFYYYGDRIKELIYQEETCLYLYNDTILKQFLHWLDLDIKINYSKEYHPISGANDYRIILNGKHLDFPQERYIQVFSDKFPFFPNLSILDLILNEGPVGRKRIKNEELRMKRTFRRE